MCLLCLLDSSAEVHKLRSTFHIAMQIKKSISLFWNNFFRDCLPNCLFFRHNHQIISKVKLILYSSQISKFWKNLLNHRVGLSQITGKNLEVGYVTLWLMPLCVFFSLHGIKCWLESWWCPGPGKNVSLARAPVLWPESHAYKTLGRLGVRPRCNLLVGSALFG